MQVGTRLIPFSTSISYSSGPPYFPTSFVDLLLCLFYELMSSVVCLYQNTDLDLCPVGGDADAGGAGRLLRSLELLLQAPHRLLLRLALDVAAARVLLINRIGTR